MTIVPRICNQIRERLDLGMWNAGDRLPSLAQLALMFGVSRTTIWKAVKACQAESLLWVRPRGLIHAGPYGVFQSEKTPKRDRAWEQVKKQLGREILSGVFARRRLPPTGKLAMKYGVNFRTLRRALDELVREGLLTGEGCGFRESGAHASRYRSTIVFIAVGSRDRGLLLKEARTLSVVENFERECQQMGYAHRTEPFDQGSTSSVLETSANIKAMPAASGFVVNIWNPWDAAIWKRWVDLFRFIISRKAPLIVLDQSSNLLFPDDVRNSSNFRVIRIAGERAGEKVGDYLVQRGHHRVAFVSPYFSQPWAKERYRGLSRFYARYGGKQSAIELFAKDTIDNQTDFALGLLSPDAQAVRGLYEGRYSSDQIQGVFSDLRRIRKLKLPEEISDTISAQSLRPFAKTLGQVTGGKHDPAIISEIQHLILHLAGASGLSNYLSHFMESVAKQSKATSWVCSDDKSALVACSVLRRLGRSIPGEVAVIGFDNWSGAYEQQLTAYDFDMTGMTRKSLLMIADRKLFAHTPVFTEIDGYLVERRTT
jgi:DNA-binding transcriptional regulator YhcF (GntR family)